MLMEKIHANITSVCLQEYTGTFKLTGFYSFRVLFPPEDQDLQFIAHMGNLN